MSSNIPIPWRLRSLNASSPDSLTIDQIQRIASRFGFEDRALLALSRKLAMAQSNPLSLSRPDLIEAKRDRGTREAQKLVDDLRKAEKALTKAQERLSLLHFSNPLAHTGMPNSAKHHLDAFHSAATTISIFRDYVETMKRHEEISYAELPDRRKERDLRREIVCFTVFNFWEEHGRSLSFTTDPDTSERGGELFAFINSIVECMTAPSTNIAGESLRMDLKRFRDFQTEAS